MARYNHFGLKKYQTINFADVPIGDKFRMTKGTNQKTRYDIIMIKTGELSYKEFKNKKEYTLFSSNLDVSSYDRKAEISTKSN